MPVTKFRIRMMEDGRPQYEIAQAVGVSPARVSEYALGKRAIPTNHIYTFVREFRCNVDDLLGYEPDEGLGLAD